MSEADFVNRDVEAFGRLLSGLLFCPSTDPVMTVYVLEDGQGGGGGEQLEEDTQQEESEEINRGTTSAPHLSWFHRGIVDGDKVSWDTVTPPQLSRDAPIPAETTEEPTLSIYTYIYTYTHIYTLIYLLPIIPLSIHYVFIYV